MSDFSLTSLSEHGYSYSQFTHQQNLASVVLNRKVLSELAIYEPYSFKAVVDVARAAQHSQEGAADTQCDDVIEQMSRMTVRAPIDC